MTFLNFICQSGYWCIIILCWCNMLSLRREIFFIVNLWTSLILSHMCSMLLIFSYRYWTGILCIEERILFRIKSKCLFWSTFLVIERYGSSLCARKNDLPFHILCLYQVKLLGLLLTVKKLDILLEPRCLYYWI